MCAIQSQGDTLCVLYKVRETHYVCYTYLYQGITYNYSNFILDKSSINKGPLGLVNVTGIQPRSQYCKWCRNTSYNLNIGTIQ